MQSRSRQSAQLSVEAWLLVLVTVLIGGFACDDEQAVDPASLRSPKTFVYAPNCRPGGVWTAAEDCPEGAILEGRAYVTNEESASVAFISVDDDGADLIDTRPSIPGVTPVLVGARPTSAAATRDGAFVLTSNALTADLSIIEVGRSRELAYVTVDDVPVELERNPASDEFWILYPTGQVERRTLSFDCGEGDAVYVDGCELEPEDITFDGEVVLELEGSPRTLAFDPVRPRFYVAYADELYVSVVAMEGSDENCLDGSTEYPCEVARLPGGYSCADGIDNDGDGFTDGQDPQCYRQSGSESPDSVGFFITTDCSDVIDNERGTDQEDGLSDAFDPGCLSANDASENEGMQPLTPTQCTDGMDNDGDGLMDNRDPDCLNEDDDDEGGSVLIPACNDGFDNDGDGDIDFPADQNCSGPDDGAEGESTACADGLDNDGDGAIDMEDDGCLSPHDEDELPDLGPCGNGIDDDGDGLVDLADDGCYGVNGPTERAVERIGLGPLAVDPEGRWLYVVDSSIWQVVVVDLESNVALDAGRLNPLSSGAGLRVNPVPMAVAADTRNRVIFDEGGVVVERDETSFYVASTAGTLDFGSVTQTFRRIVNGEESDSVSIQALRISDNQADQARVASERCTGGQCATQPAVTLRQRPTVLIGPTGELITEDEEGLPASVPADEIFRSESWSLLFQGVIPGSLRSDGVVDAEVPGRITAGVNFCSIGVRPGDIFEVAAQPANAGSPPCDALVPTEGILRFRVASVRADAIIVEPTGNDEDVEQVPLRECYPFGLEFQVRANGDWIVQGEASGSLLDLETRRNLCVEGRRPLGKGRFSSDEFYENAYFSTSIPDDFIVEQGRGFEFAISTGYRALRRTIGPLPGDVDVVNFADREYIFVPDAGSNQVFIYDSVTLRGVDSL